MLYAKPRPSAGLMVAGVLLLAAAALVRWLPLALSGAGILAGILGLGGVICLVVAVWRLFSALDAALLHRWQALVEQKSRQAQAGQGANERP